MHIYLKGAHVATCKKCKKDVLPHTVCGNCGFYNDKEAIDVLGKLSKKERKQKEREMAKEVEEKEKPGELSPEQLSRSS